MEPLRASNFRKTLLASGLLTPEQVQDAEAAVLASEGGQSADARRHATLLAQRLVELGLLNSWQVEHLRAGRTKFNLGPYRIIDSLGAGGMGQVFKAEHTIMERIVAVKVLPRHRATPTAVACFAREIRVQAQLDHENLVSAFDAGYDGNVYYLVTEYVPGTNLRKFVRARGRISMHDAATIISQAAAGLHYAHTQGLIHRDVKPGNLLVTTSGHTKVSDLGLAAVLDAEGDTETSGRIVGTADYLSPEQIRTPRSVSPASDVYSLGCTLYYAVTGKVPFPGGTSREKTQRQCEEAPADPRRLNPDLSPEFVAVLMGMMEKDPSRRIQSAAEVIERLRPWKGEAVSTTLEETGQETLPTAFTGHSLFGEGTEHGDEAVSEASLGTDAIAASGQETLPDGSRYPRRWEEPDPTSWRLVVLVGAPLLLAAAMLVASLLLKAIW